MRLPLAVAQSLVPYIRAGVYLAITLVAARLLDWVLSRRIRSLVRVLGRPLEAAEGSRLRVGRRLAVVAVLFVGVTLALIQIPQVGSLARGMAASAGITALIVGLAARSVIANFLSGLIIAFSQPVRIGDYVAVDDAVGVVEEVRLTYTHIRSDDNRRVLIPNDLLTSKVIHNYSLVDPASSVAVEFEVPVAAPVGAVCSAALEEAERLGGHPHGAPPNLEVTAVTLDAVRLRLTVWGETRQDAAGLAEQAQRAILARLQSEGLVRGGGAAGA